MKRGKDKLQFKRRNLQITYVTKELHQEDIKHSQNSILHVYKTYIIIHYMYNYVPYKYVFIYR